MQIQELVLHKAEEYLASGKVDRVLAWKKGETFYDNSPAIFTKDNLNGFVYNEFCAANLSKYLVNESRKEGKILVFLKPCDTYSFNQLVSEHRIDREKIVVIGLECQGMLDEKKIYNLGFKRIEKVEDGLDNIIITADGKQVQIKREELLSVKCVDCKSKEFAVADETIVVNEMKQPDKNSRFSVVSELEKMTEEERFKFWQNELSKCIRCNACRNVCPACTCTHCVFDNNKSGIAGKANSDSFEEKLYHIIRAYHVAGRCTDCGECSRVCPESIPLHLINRKFIKDINDNYGEFQAGKTVSEHNPLVDYTKGDCEPKEMVEK